MAIITNTTLTHVPPPGGIFTIPQLQKSLLCTIERKAYSASEFEEPYACTSDVPLSKKEALDFISSPSFRQAADYKSRVNDVINGLHREMKEGDGINPFCNKQSPADRAEAAKRVAAASASATFPSEREIHPRVQR